MSIDLIASYIENSLFDPKSVWDENSLRQLALMEMPQLVFRDKQTLLKGDQVRLWTRWFLEGLISPQPFIKDLSKDELHIFEIALSKIGRLYPDADLNQRKLLASAISKRLFCDIKRKRESEGRDYATIETRRALVEASSHPKCYLCGYHFSKEAIDAFLRVRGRNQVILPTLIDIFRPRLIERDVKIEIEHVVPVAEGGNGQDNLKLACGWCNKYKSDKTSIYEANLSPSKISFKIDKYELHELPEPFWQIRLLGIGGRCQHSDGCSTTTNEKELFIALKDWDGSPNPTNLRLYCAEHDPISSYRFMPRDFVSEIWGGRER